jgi:hypothetical protein
MFDIRTDRFDYTGCLKTRRIWQFRFYEILSLAEKVIGKVDADGVVFD